MLRDQFLCNYFKPAELDGDPRKGTFFVRWVSDVIL